MGEWIDLLNRAGCVWVETCIPAVVQSTLLAGLLLLGTWSYRRQLHPATRTWLWMLVFIQLMVVPGLRCWSHAGGRSAQTAWRIDLPSPGLPETTGHPATAPAGPHRLSASTHGVGLPDSPRVTLTRPGWMFLAWWMGLVVAVLVWVGRLWRQQRVLIASRPGTRPLRELFAYCCELVGFERPVRLRVSSWVQEPQVVGLWRPVIVLPQALGRHLGSRALRASLIDQLTYLKHHYDWLDRLQTVLAVLYFYHPLVWIVRRLNRRTTEQAVSHWVRCRCAGPVADHERWLERVRRFTRRSVPWYQLVGRRMGVLSTGMSAAS